MYAHRCKECGAFLYPGEKCDCIEEREKEKKQKELEWLMYLLEENNGQLKMAV